MSHDWMAVVPGLLMLFAVPAFGGDDEYGKLVKRLQAGDTSIDFTALRFAYARTPDYSPYQSDDREEKLGDAMDKKSWKKAVRTAQEILDDNYVNGNAHVAAVIAYRELGQETESAFHREIVERLLDSICGESQGRSRDKPCKVIAVGEEYFYIGLRGLESGRQAISACAEGPCDAMVVRDPGRGTEFTLYFDTTVPMEWMAKNLGE